MSISYKNTKTHFGLVSIVLHWLTAITVVFLFSLGLYMTGLDYYDPFYQQGPWLHKSIGVILFGILLFRCVWRLLNPKPKMLSGSALERAIAKYAHFVLYLIVFSVTISGYLISSADNSSVSVFDWFEVPGFVINVDNQEDKAGLVHYYLAWVLIVLASLHALAAIKHHFIDRDATLRRMIIPKAP